MEKLIAKATIDICKAPNLEYGEVEVIVSTPTVDRHGETVNVKGINTSQYEKNPVVLFGHDYSAPPIGKATRVWKSAGQLKAKIRFATEILPFADTVYKLIKGGFLNAVSIGGAIVENGVEDKQVDYTHIASMDMFEFSIVPIGANPEALVTAKAIEAGFSQETISKQYREYVEKTNQDKIEAENLLILKYLQSGMGQLLGNSTSSVEKPVSKRLVLSRKRKTARTMKSKLEEFITELNKELKGLHNG